MPQNIDPNDPDPAGYLKEMSDQQTQSARKARLYWLEKAGNTENGDDLLQDRGQGDPSCLFDPY